MSHNYPRIQIKDKGYIIEFFSYSIVGNITYPNLVDTPQLKT